MSADMSVCQKNRLYFRTPALKHSLLDQPLLSESHLFLSCPPTPPTTSAEPTQQKTFKRKRSLINWPFWKGSSTQLDGLPLSPTSLSPTLGRLFGRPLSAVCSSDHGLPKPVMVSRVYAAFGKREKGRCVGTAGI